MSMTDRIASIRSELRSAVDSSHLPEFRRTVELRERGLWRGDGGRHFPQRDDVWVRVP